MMHWPAIFAGAGGGKGGDTPTEAPDSIFTNQIARVIDLLSEGEIEGLVDGLKSVFYNEIALQNADNSYNFQGATVVANHGTTDQPAISGFDDVKSSVSVAQDMPANTGKSISFPNDGDVSTVIVTISGSNWYKADDSGNVNPTSCSFKIEKSENSGAFVLVDTYTIRGKQNDEFDIDYRVPIDDTRGQTAIRVTRTTADSSTLKDSNGLTFKSYTKCSEYKLSYPNYAIAAHIINAKQFGNKVPTRQYRARGIKCRVPSNYDPVARTYTGPWDGTFKAAKAYTSNPSWQYLELVTNKRFGLGQFFPEAYVDLPSLYMLSKWVDAYEARLPVGTAGKTDDYDPVTGCHGVPDGKGGFEPRWTCNEWITTRGQAFDVLKDMISSFRGNLYWMQAKLWALSDGPRTPVKIVTNANVKGGKFSYTGNSNRNRNSVVNVTFHDPDLMYRRGIETVENGDLIRKLGYKDTTFGGFGCSSRSQANRLGKALLFTQEYESSLVSYTAAWDHMAADGTDGPDGVAPGDQILIADKERGNARAGGRVFSVAGTNVTLDRNVGVTSGNGTLYVEHASGAVEWLTCTYSTADLDEDTKTVVSLTQTPVETIQTNDLFILVDTGFDAEPFIVVKIREVSKFEAEITAVKWDEGRWAAIYDEPALGAQRSYMSLTNSKVGYVQPAVGPVKWTDRFTYSGDLYRRFIDLNWTPSPDANLSHYLVRYSFAGGEWVVLPPAGAAQATIPSAMSGDYTVQVYATNGQGYFSPVLEATFTVGVAPDALALPLGTIANATCIPDTGSVAAPVANTPSTATTGGTLLAGTYFYKITALNQNGESLASNEVSKTTTGSTSTVTLTWAAVPNATGYRIYRGTTAGGEGVYYTVSAVTTFTDTNAASTAGAPPTTNTAKLGNFAADHVTIAWDLTTPTGKYLQTQGVGITTGVSDPSFLDCLVTVKTMTGAVLRQVSVVGNTYNYTRSNMYEDNGGTVLSQFKFEIQYRDIYGRIGPVTTLICQNTVPAVPTGMSVSGGALLNEIRFTRPTFPDYSYSEIWGSQTNDVVTAALLGKDPVGVFDHTSLTAGNTWYYWLTNVDTWGSVSAKTFAGSGVVQSTALYDTVGQDGVLSPVEKQGIIREWNQLTNEKSSIDTQATALAITTEKTNYDNAYTTLGSYLTSLSPAYTDTAHSTNIVRTTWNTNWQNLYAARQTLLRQIDNVAAASSAVGDGNRVRFSRMEQGTVGFTTYDTSAGTGPMDQGTTLGKRYLHVSGNFTANSQVGSIGTAGASTATSPFIIPVTPGERLFVGASVRSANPNSGCTTSLIIFFYQSSGAPSAVNALSTVFTGNGSDPFWTRRGGFATVPSDAAFAIMEYRTQNNALGITGAWDLYLAEPLVCGAGALQTTLPNFSPGPSGEFGAEVNRWIANPTQSLVFSYDYQGNAIDLASGATRDIAFRLLSSAGQVTSGVTWSYVVKTGTIDGFTNASGSQTMAVSGGTGTITVSSLATDTATVEVTATYGVLLYKYTAEFKRSYASPPTGVSGGGGTGTTTLFSKTSGFGVGFINSTTFADVTGTITFTATGTVNLSANLTFDPVVPGPGSWTVELKWQQLISGTWTDLTTPSPTVGTGVTDVVAASDGDPAMSDNTTITNNKTITASGSTSVRCVARITSGTKQHNISGFVNGTQ
jgi:predicted phage tail protein